MVSATNMPKCPKPNMSAYSMSKTQHVNISKHNPPTPPGSTGCESAFGFPPSVPPAWDSGGAAGFPSPPQGFPPRNIKWPASRGQGSAALGLDCFCLPKRPLRDNVWFEVLIAYTLDNVWFEVLIAYILDNV